MSGRLLPQPRALLPNSWASTPRAVGDLHLWASGDSLQASDLNANFLLLLGLIGTATAEARQPDEIAETVCAWSVEADERLEALENHAKGTERERNLRQYAPLALIGSLQRQIAALSGPIQQECERLRAEIATQRQSEGHVAARVTALEDRPHPATAPTVEQFAALQKELKQAQAEARTAFGQVAGLRAELAALRKLVTDPDRGTQNKRLYAPLAAVGQLLHRIAAIEARLDRS